LLPRKIGGTLIAILRVKALDASPHRLGVTIMRLNWHDLIREESDPQYIVSTPEPKVDSYVALVRINGTAGRPIILRGARCPTRQRVFDEWAAALQFPSYFGYNWAAWDEMVRDLEWLPAPVYALFLTRTEELLARDDEEFGTLTSILARIARDGVRTQVDVGWEPALLRVVYHASPGHYEEVLARLRRAGVHVIPAELGDPE